MKLVVLHPESRTLTAVLSSISRKGLSSNERYEKMVTEGLEQLGLIKKIASPKGLFFFKTEKSNNFKAIDFAMEFLWNFHNVERRAVIDGKRHIFCYDSHFENGQKMVEIKEALKMRIV